MPSIFLSYSRAEENQAARLSEQLQSLNIGVWQDQLSLRVGDNWSSKLGEAIAQTDALVLLWSKQAANSQWVEREWSVALAIPKPVFPCRLDNTPLPPSLRPTQAINARDPARAAENIAAALGHATKSLPNSHNHKRQKFIIVIASIVLAILLTVALVLSQPPKQILAGTINDETGRRPLPHVQLSLIVGGQVAAITETDLIGHYRFEIPGTPDQEVELVAQKAPYPTKRKYVHLGHTDVGFNMTKE